MAQETNYGLLIAALVAVVAIVGLVIFSTGGSGAVVFTSSSPSPIVLGSQGSFEEGRQSWYDLGRNVASRCVDQDTTKLSFGDSRRCCNDVCASACDGVGEYKISGRTVDDCFRNCKSGCNAVIDETFMVG
ncbi:MAG: hypothetical protein ACE5FT_04205 [Candidatus Nanoarchaeia archaeon]